MCQAGSLWCGAILEGLGSRTSSPANAIVLSASKTFFLLQLSSFLPTSARNPEKIIPSDHSSQRPSSSFSPKPLH